MFIYRLVAGDHSQTGVVCEVPVAEYEQGHLRVHENTLSEKEDMLAKYLQVVGVSSSPICMTYPHDDGIDTFLKQQMTREPVLDFVSDDGVAQTVWCINGNEEQQALQTLFEQVPITYLTDGHHRAASGRRYAQQMREQHGNRGDEPYNQLLVALFSDIELNVLPFHRCVRDLNGLSEPELVQALQKEFQVEPLPGVESFDPEQRGVFGMLVNHHWYRVTIDPPRVNQASADPASIDHDDPVASLDVSILQDRILGPILGIEDSRNDPRLGYFSGASDDEGLHARCREGWAVCFACHATSIEELMAVADAGGLMPPKSTYFDPKARSGIFVRRR
jgi:uncharacterized protein (DUF1015 family)